MSAFAHLATPDKYALQDVWLSCSMQLLILDPTCHKSMLTSPQMDSAVDSDDMTLRIRTDLQCQAMEPQDSHQKSKRYRQLPTGTHLDHAVYDLCACLDALMTFRFD